MATFLRFLKWTEQGARSVKDVGKRAQSARVVTEKLGGRIVSTYLTTGAYDVVVTVEMPNGEAMSRMALSIAASGNTRTTVRAYSVDEFTKLVAEISNVLSYSASKLGTRPCRKGRLCDCDV
jgi:uncharacterized protein with GYD domain